MFQPKSDLFSTRALIWVHFKTVYHIYQPIFSLFSYLKIQNTIKSLNFFVLFPPYDRGTESQISICNIIGTFTKVFHVHLNTNSIELWNLARELKVISSLLCRRRRANVIPCLIWMIRTSLFHICLVHQLMNCIDDRTD